MRRSPEQALLDLRQHLIEWRRSGGRPNLRIFVYPPEWEALMLARFPEFARDCLPVCPLAVVDLGPGFLAEIERRPGFAERLIEHEQKSGTRVLHDLGEIAGRYLARLLATPLEPPAFARLLVNPGALATFVSYSAIGNGSYAGDDAIAAPTVLAFPGEDDVRSLSLLRLRPDTNYRNTRI